MRRSTLRNGIAADGGFADLREGRHEDFGAPISSKKCGAAVKWRLTP
jgi:hypothetical protein